MQGLQSPNTSSKGTGPPVSYEDWRGQQQKKLVDYLDQQGKNPAQYFREQ